MSGPAPAGGFFPVAYDELRRLAAAKLRGGAAGHTPSPSALVREAYRLTRGRVPIVGVGGVFTPEDAYAKIRAGASLVEVYTALIYEGPGLPARINRGLSRLLERDGFTSVTEAVGADAR